MKSIIIYRIFLKIPLIFLNLTLFKFLKSKMNTRKDTYNRVNDLRNGFCVSNFFPRLVYIFVFITASTTIDPRALACRRHFYYDPPVSFFLPFLSPFPSFSFFFPKSFLTYYEEKKRKSRTKISGDSKLSVAFSGLA